MRGAPLKTSVEAVLAEARVLFAERGVAATSIADLADAAGIAKGTFYRYFDSKEALVDAVFQPEAAELVRLVSDSGGKPRIADLSAALLAFFGAHPLFLSELRLAWRSHASYSFVDAARASFVPLTRSYFRRDGRYNLADLDTYSELIVGAVLDLCSWRAVEGKIEAEAEAGLMLQDFLKRFFDCEP